MVGRFASERPIAPRVRALLTLLLPWGLGLLAVLVLAPPPMRLWDFGGSYYPAALLARHGQSPYLYTLANLHRRDLTVIPTGGLYVYPPLLALLLAPLTVLSAQNASFVWYVLNLSLVAGTAWCLATLWFPKQGRMRTAGMLWLFLLALYPIQFVLTLGQADILTLAATTAAVLLAGQACDGRAGPLSAWGAGALLATATLVKLYPAPLLLYYLYRRQYRVVGAALLTGAGWMALCAGLLGGNTVHDYLTVLLQGSGPVFAAAVWAFGSLSLLDRLLSPTPYATPLLALPHGIVLALYLGWVLLWLTACLRALPSWSMARGTALELALWLAGALLIFPKLEVMHLGLLSLVAPGWWVWLQTTSEHTTNSSSPQERRFLALFLACLYLSGLLHAHWSRQAVVRVDLLLTGLLVALCLRLPSVARRNRTQRRVIAGLVGLYFLLEGPAFFTLPSWWGVPMSTIDGILGGLQLYLLVLATYYCCVLLRHERDQVRGTLPPRTISTNPVTSSISATSGSAAPRPVLENCTQT